MASRIVVLRKGSVEQIGAPLDLYNNPDNKFVAGFIGSPRMNFIDGVVESVDEGALVFAMPGDGGRLTLPRRGLPVRAGQRVTLGIRPEHLVPSPQDGPGLAAAVVSAEQHGAASFLHCELAGSAPMLVHEPGQTGARRGDRLRLNPAEGSWHLFDEAEQAIRA